MKVLITPTSLQPGKNDQLIDRVRKVADEVIFNSLGRPMTEDELLEVLPDCDGYIAGLDSVTAKVLEKCDHLQVVSRYGAGVDRVDLAAAKAKGIKVTNTPGANAEAVGELAVALMLSVARQVPYLNQSTRDGGWVRSTGVELNGKTLGILGLGAIGRVVARSAKGLGMNVIAYDPYINLDYCKENDIQSLTLDEVIREANVITLHLPLTEETHHMINREAIASMKPGCIIINASRGGIIDEEAAYDALRTGQLGGLGLDAFEVEPPTASPLFEFNNVVVTPHTGAHTKEATDNMAEMAVQNLLDVLETGDCRYVLNR